MDKAKYGQKTEIGEGMAHRGMDVKYLWVLWRNRRLCG